MKGGCWATHFFEHVLGGFDPTVSHGAGLGVIFPALVRASTARGLRQKTYAKIAKEVFGKEGAAGLIEGFQEMLTRWEHPLTLNQLMKREVNEAERKEYLAVFM